MSTAIINKALKQFFTASFVFLYATTVVYASDNRVKTPSETSENSVHSIPFLTLRNKTDSEDVSDFFGGERDILRAGYCDVSRTPSQVLKSIAENVPFYIPEDFLQFDAIRESPVEKFWMDFEKALNGQSPVLYTHGFYISFERGCKRASEFKRSLDLAGRFVLFSWPSDGVIVNYTRDEADVYWSVDPLQAMLSGMIERFGAGQINIVAHSLGTRGVMLALIRLAKVEKSADKPLINKVVLLAPDIDAGIFKQYLPQLKALAKNITIYVSEHDSPLALSTQIHGYPRLGETGSHLEVMDGVVIVDVSDVPVQYPSGHLYHLYNDEVIADLYQLLNENKAVAERSNLKQTGNNYWRLQPAADEVSATIDESANR